MTWLDFHTHHYPTANNIQANFNIDLAETENNASLIIKAENINYSIGLHPWFLKNIFFGEREYGIWFIIKELAQTHGNKIIALGELGLDKNIENELSFTMQNSLFQKQIELAQALHKPLILHTVNRYNETLAILKENSFENSVAFHGFNKKASIGQMLWLKNYYTSFGAAIFHSPTAQESLKKCPNHLLFLETDMQQEYDIINIYEKAAFLRNVSITTLQSQIEENYKRFCTTI